MPASKTPDTEFGFFTEEILFSYLNKEKDHGILLVKTNGVLFGVSGSSEMLKNFKIWKTPLNTPKLIIHALSQFEEIKDGENLHTFIELLISEFYKHSDIVSLTPVAPSPPGDTIKDLLTEKGWSRIEFADRMGLTIHYIDNLIKGIHPITTDVAESLSQVLGSTPEFWITRDAQYQVLKQLMKSQ